MLMIRLSRTGRKNLPVYQIVVTEKANPAKGGSFLEKVGYYSPTGQNPILEYDTARIEHWISNGAKPSETVARLLHKEGVAGMDKYYNANKKFEKKSKKAEEEAPAPVEDPAAAAAEGASENAEGAGDAPVEAPAEEEKPAEEAAAPEEKPAEEPAPAPAEEAPTEEEKLAEEAS